MLRIFYRVRSAYRDFFAYVNRYERHLSAAAMIAGFAWDNVFLGRIDVSRTQIVLLVYIGVCVLAMPFLHFIELRGERTGKRPRWRGVLPIFIQFALGGFWSAFLILYGRAAVISASWPFLLVLFSVFIANEWLRKYHERLVFTSVLFFFALYAYAVFELPIVVDRMGTGIFLASGAVATLVFFVFLGLLSRINRPRFRADARRITTGVVMALLVINVSYFTGVLPPLPLAAKAGGIYHAVWRTDSGYMASWETNQPWLVQYLGFAPTLHVAPGESVYAYSAVFAPAQLTTTIVHQWQWYNPAKGMWETRAAIAYPIQGGRDGGYRGYSTILPHDAGSWRVNVVTLSGLVIARMPFTIDFVQLPPPEVSGLLDR